MDLKHSEESILSNLEIATELLNSAFDAFEAKKYITATHLAGGVITGLPRTAKNLPVSLEEFAVREQVLKTGGAVTEEEISDKVHEVLWGPHNRLKHHDSSFKFKKSEALEQALNTLAWANSVYINHVDRVSVDKELLKRIDNFFKGRKELRNNSS